MVLAVRRGDRGDAVLACRGGRQAEVCRDGQLLDVLDDGLDQGCQLVKGQAALGGRDVER